MAGPGFYQRESQLREPLARFLRRAGPIRLLSECVVPWGKIDLVAVDAAQVIYAFELKLARGVDVLIQARNNRALTPASYAVLPLAAAWRIQDGRHAPLFLDSGAGILGISDSGSVEVVLDHNPQCTPHERRLQQANAHLRNRIRVRSR